MADRGTIIIVSRNNMLLTQQAVMSAYQQKDVECDVLLVDNHSDDNTLAWARTKNWLTVIALPEQLSLAAAWNEALVFTFSIGRKHALVCNNDIVLRSDTYRWLLADGHEFVTCVSVDSKDKLRYPDAPTSFSPHPDFSCFLIHKHVYDTVGVFNESLFPAFFEDNDYHVRMHRKHIVAGSIDVPFYHHSSATIKHADRVEKKRIEMGFERNKEWFRREYGCYPGTKEYEDLFK